MEIAILFKKNHIGANNYVFIPECTIFGHYNSEKEMFESENGTDYGSMDDSQILLSDADSCVGFIKKIDAKKINRDKMGFDYLIDYNNKFIIGSYDEKGNKLDYCILSSLDLKKMKYTKYSNLNKDGNFDSYVYKEDDVPDKLIKSFKSDPYFDYGVDDAMLEDDLDEEDKKNDSIAKSDNPDQMKEENEKVDVVSNTDEKAMKALTQCLAVANIYAEDTVEKSKGYVAAAFSSVFFFCYCNQPLDEKYYKDTSDKIKKYAFIILNQIYQICLKKCPELIQFPGLGEPEKLVFTPNIVFESVEKRNLDKDGKTVSTQKVDLTPTLDDKNKHGVPAVINKEKEQIDADDEMFKDLPVLSVREIADGIKKNVVAQDEPIKQIAIKMHKRLLQLKLPAEQRGRFGMLVTGSTGVGKTEIFETLSKMVNLPILKIDSTQLSKTGYVGKNIEDFLTDLVESCDGNIAEAEKAIVIFDEVDKKASSQSLGFEDVGGKAVQDSMLKFMDGTTYSLGSLTHPMGLIRTNNMTVISVGAFYDLYHKHDDDKAPIGIGASKEENKIIIPTVKQFKDYGMCDEFIGRHYNTIHLNDLNADALEQILRKSAKSPTLYQNAIYESVGVQIRWMDSFYKEAAKKAYEYKTGARSLAKVIEDATSEPMVAISDNPGKYKKLILSDRTVNDPKKYTLK